MTFKSDLEQRHSEDRVQTPQPICQQLGGGVARKFAPCLVALILFLGASAQEAITAYELPGENVYPEGVAYSSETGNFYVGSSANGAIFQGSPETGEVRTLVEGGSDASPEAAYGLALDAQNRLWVAGGPTGMIYVYDAESGEQLRGIQIQIPEAENTFLNDVVVTRSGDAYVTDSYRPVLFRVAASADGVWELEPWLDLTGTPIEYTTGDTPLERTNLNGVTVTPDGRYLLTVDMNDGRLYRIDTASKEVTEIDLGGETLVNGDGLVLDGQTLYVVRIADNEIVTVELSEDYVSGTVQARFSDPALIWPATAAKVDDRLLVVNTQFNRQEEGNPELPFSVLSIPVSMIEGGQGQQAGQQAAQQQSQAQQQGVQQDEAAGTTSYNPVTDERLRDPEPGNWLMYRRTYDGWGYSPLEQINGKNVSRLRPVWSFSTGLLEGHEAPPIVNDGMMFVSTPENQVIALEAATGDLLWRYERELPHDLFQLHPTNRGVALYDDKLYLATLDAHLVALDATTGEVIWDKTVEDHRDGYYMTLAPLVASGKVMVGVSGGELGIRGFVQAFDAASGEPAWKTYTIPGPGEPGNETWPGNTWQHGGAPIWVTGSYDPELNLTYWGTGNAAPWIGEARPGDNLYTTSVIALDADTGELKAHHQYHWNGSWDWDEVAAPILVDFEREGRTIKGLVHAARSGYLWFLERSADEITFVDAQPYVYQNVFESLDPETGRPEYDPEHKPVLGEETEFCPSLWGGKDWPPVAYNPQTGYVYIPANENHCGRLEGVEQEYRAGQTYFGANIGFYVREGADHFGELQAWDVNTGEEVWTHEFEDSHNWGPVLTTAGDLVFMGGTNDRYFRAFDAENGEVLWEYRTSSGIIGVPVSFEVDGTQYIAVQSGWGVDAVGMQESIAAELGEQWDVSVPQGGTVLVFALEDQVGSQSLPGARGQQGQQNMQEQDGGQQDPEDQQ